VLAGVTTQEEYNKIDEAGIKTMIPIYVDVNSATSCTDAMETVRAYTLKTKLPLICLKRFGIDLPLICLKQIGFCWLLVALAQK
jgi:hypothetical protein